MPVKSRPWRLSAALILSLSLLVPAAGSAETIQTDGFSYDVAETPDWVSPTAVPTEEQAAQYGVREWVGERQSSWLGPRRVHYVRQLREAVNATGLEHVAKYQLDFDPAYQTLIIHRLRVQRGGQWSDRARDPVIELLRRENQLESSQYHGEVTASINLPDVRVGDRVELAYSIVGSNPSFDGVIASSLPLAGPFPIGRLQVRLLLPRDVPVDFKVVGDSVQVTDKAENGARVLTVERTRVPALNYEDRAPNSVIQMPFLQISSLRRWEEVAAWGERLFRVDEPVSADFRQKVKELKAIARTDERIAAALRFTQEEIRYFGMEIGTNSHRPHAPDLVLQRRFGDCKDKTVLLYWLLKAAGISSTPALVDTTSGGALDRVLPSPTPFDHVILRVEDAGKTYWLDPTVTGQGQRLATLGQFDFGHALPLNPREGALQKMAPVRSAPTRLAVKEIVNAPDLSGRAEIVVEAVFRFEDAERLRRMVQYLGREKFEERWADAMRAKYSQAVPVAPVELHDDPLENRVLTRERYRVEQAYVYQGGVLKFSIQPVELRRFLEQPEKTQRRYPLAMEYPAEVEYRYELNSPFVDKAPYQPTRLEGPYLSFTDVGTAAPGRLAIDFRLKTLAPEVPVKDLPAFYRLIKAAYADTGLAYRLNALNHPVIEREVRRDPPAAADAETRETRISRAVTERILAETAPMPEIEAALLDHLAWQDMQLGDTERAAGRLRRLLAIPEHDPAAAAALGAAVHLYLNRPDEAWSRYQDYLARAAEAPSWTDLRTGALIQILRGRPGEAAAQLSGALEGLDAENRSRLGIWLALALRMRDGAKPEVPASWPEALLPVDGDGLSRAMLTEAGPALERRANVYAVSQPGSARLIWLALALEQLKRGNRDAARPLLQRILGLDGTVMVEVLIARGLLDRP